MNGLLTDKTALIMGVANRWSIAWAIAQAFSREGAGLVFTFQGERQEKDVRDLAGALDGASGFILSVNMSKAMNRSFTNVLFGAFGQEQAAAAADFLELVARDATAELG